MITIIINGIKAVGNIYASPFFALDIMKIMPVMAHNQLDHHQLDKDFTCVQADIREECQTMVSRLEIVRSKHVNQL